MPDTRGKPLASEILPLLKDPSISNWLRSFLIQTASAESIGRFPGNGSAQDDQYVYPDAADSTHAYNFDYVIPSNFQRLVVAKLSFKIRPFRTYNTISGVNTGNDNADHVHGMTHTHSHSHTWHITLNAGINANIGLNAAVPQIESTLAAADIGTTTDATASSASLTGGRSAFHQHPLNLSQTLGITESAAPLNPGITVAVDGTDVTASLGGPFNADQVEIDVTKVLKTSIKTWHVMTLQPNQNVRITGILRISYYVDSRLAQ